ncbi:hypothetical protein [Enterococcus sp. 5B3_DIV0040]|uniref:hypothetical protein n=1 Tax=Enterococcus sp. 5B3_DIV0040 TaxID=1834182 RepID=UPI000A353DC7|nr:hypothetical protein [Enterococcus sp. 5B3_DIV0040]OTO02229.1 hypothetical protein A5883_003056 [Enterococcus sp. 5B3_DIV0040]
MNRKKGYFCFFVIVSTALLVYSVVDRYDKELPKELAEFSWQLSVLLDYPFFLLFFFLLLTVFVVIEKDFGKEEEGKIHSRRKYRKSIFWDNE